MGEKMLRKRSRSIQKDQQNMGHMTNSDVNLLDNYSCSPRSHALGHNNMKSHSIFNVPCLFVGLGPKSLLDSDSVRSPTSPLDARVLSSNLGTNNPVRTPRSSSPIIPESGGGGCVSHRSWDCWKVGLSIIDSLEDCSKFCGKILRSSESKNISLSPEMMIKTTICQACKDSSFESSKSLPKDFCKAPLFAQNGSTFHKGESSVVFEIGESSLEQSRSSSLDSFSPLKTLCGLTASDTGGNYFGLKRDKDSSTILLSSPPHFIGGSQNSNSLTLSISSSNDFVKSLSASEIEQSEDYTCVISHGPNPKTTHIFGDCILETSLSNEFKNHFKNEEKKEEENEKKGGGVNLVVDNMLHTPHSLIQYPSNDFLSFCHHCSKKLLEGKDIYIYRGEKSFCSLTCRAMEIMIDEELEKSNTPSESSPEPEHGEQIFETGIFTAT